MLNVENVTKRFSAEGEVYAVRDVSLNLARGEFLAVVGRSGSGKSTLLSMIGGLNKPTSGTILIDSINPWTLKDGDQSDFRNQSIGFVFQFASLLPTLRAIDNVALPALIGGALDYKDAYARAHQLLNHVGLVDRFDKFPGQLSGGEQRRVAIARALINSPSLILADEPTADLDQDTEEEILNLLIEIHRTFNLTMLVVTHSNAIAERANQILRMNRGEVESLDHSKKELISVPLQFAPDAALNAARDLPCNGAARDGTARIEDQSIHTSRAEKIFQRNNDVSVAEAIRLGEGVERLIGRYVLWIIPMVLLVWGLNTAVGLYEKNILEAKENQRIELEDLAMRGLRCDIKEVTNGPGKTYIVTLYFTNTLDAGKPIFVMAPAVRGFVQVGSNWQEVTMKAATQADAKVLKITGDQTYSYILEPEVTGYTQLLPYYMHVRITNDMLISPSDQPKSDLVERNDSYYVYLKPKDAEDAKILKKMKFPGKPPVWIPMPPH